MILCIIFPIHVNFPIRSRCVLKAIIHRKKNSELFYLCYLRKLFFKKILEKEEAESICAKISITLQNSVTHLRMSTKLW